MTVRLPSVIAGIITTIIIFSFHKSLGNKVAGFASFLFAISPLAIRANRLVYLDSILVCLFTFIAFAIWRYYHSQVRFWLIVIGLTSGLALSTKINGALGLILILTLMIKIGLLGNSKIFSLELFFKIMLIIFPFVGIFVALNDPLHYIEGIIHPADFKAELLSSYSISKLIYFPEYFLKVMIFLFTPVMTVVLLIALWILRQETSLTKSFLYTWFGWSLIFFYLHRPGLSYEHGLISILPPMYLIVAYAFSRQSNFLTKVLLLVFTMLPFSFAFGWFLLPFPPENTRGLTYTHTLFQDVISYVNIITPRKGRVYFWPNAYYPFFSLRPDIHWSYYENLLSYDILVVDEKVAFSVDKTHFSEISKFQNKAYGIAQKRIIYRKNDK